ncbi:unnamed protein product [Dracunculus medinensis]|uniref:Uncharacterized protein n=1 Tax=Dracunculus medinensis TaxID=318479 RepID=A0A0N4UR89_DRAME|nr:unnamed protein product [Dracunculus medinensis]
MELQRNQRITEISHLAPISLCEFNRDPNKWEQFISSFKMMLDQLKIPNVQKFCYLLVQLKGKARMVVSLYAVTDENYPIALNALYGQRENRYHLLFSRLKNIYQVKDDFEAIRQLLMILSQLEAANHDINSEALLMLVESELSRGIYSKIIGVKAVDMEWT